MAKRGIFLTLILKLYKMAKTKKVTVSMTEETKQKALDLSEIGRAHV